MTLSDQTVKGDLEFVYFCEEPSGTMVHFYFEAGKDPRTVYNVDLSVKQVYALRKFLDQAIADFESWDYEDGSKKK
jgi:hypothetical protein